MRPWSAAEVRLLLGRPVFFSPCRHLVVESVIASGEGKPTKWGRQKVFPGQRGAPSQRDWRRFHISAGKHCRFCASCCLVSMSEVYHCSSQEETHFKRKVLDNLILYQCFPNLIHFKAPILYKPSYQCFLALFASRPSTHIFISSACSTFRKHGHQTGSSGNQPFVM